MTLPTLSIWENREENLRTGNDRAQFLKQLAVSLSFFSIVVVAHIGSSFSMSDI